MADNFVQQNSGSGTTSWSVALNSVVAGNAIVAFLGDGSNSNPTTHTVADGQGSYTAKGTPVQDGGNNVWLGVFLLENCNSGTHTITATLDSGNGGFLIVVEVGVTGQPGYQDTRGASVPAPGTGTDAVATAALTIASASTLVGFVCNSSIAGGNPPVAGTSFTSRTSGASSDIGDYRLETGDFSSNHIASATAGVGESGGTHNIIGLALANVGSGGGGAFAQRLAVLGVGA